MRTLQSKDGHEAEMYDVLAKHAAWKSPTLRALAAAIIRAALDGDGSVWPDEENLGKKIDALSRDDKNCVGTAWRWLGHAGLMQRTQQRRRSAASTSKGREITCWMLSDRALALTFLARNGTPVPDGQGELFK